MNGLVFNVSPATRTRLLERMRALGIEEADLTERFIKGSGRGGQKINKTSSCVHLVHGPSGMEVKCQRERSLAMNRFLARRLLCDRLERRQRGAVEAERAEQERIRRRKRKRSRRQKERMLEDKRKVGEKKRLRVRPNPADGDRQP